MQLSQDPNEVLLACTSPNTAAPGETTYISGKFGLCSSKVGVSIPGLQYHRSIRYLLQQPQKGINSHLLQNTKHECNWRQMIITVSITAGLLIKPVLCPEPRALPATVALQGNYSMGSRDDWWRYSLNTNLTLCSLSPNNPTRLSLTRAPSPWHVFHGGFQKKISSQVPEPRPNGGILACSWGPRAGAEAGASCAHTDPKQRALGCDSCSWLWNKHQAWRDYDRFYLYYETDFTSHMRQKMSVSQRDENPFCRARTIDRAKLRAAGGDQANGASSLHSDWSIAYGTEKKSLSDSLISV